MKLKLTIERLIKEAKEFCERESEIDNKKLFGITDGKAVGTFIEHKFTNYLGEKYDVLIGSSANGIDMPAEDIDADIKVTSIEQPQSSGELFVFAEMAPGVYQKHLIKTGVKGGGRVGVVEGVEVNEPVVVQGGFTLKSELDKGAFQGCGSGHTH